MIHIDLDEDGVASDVTTYGQEEADGVVDLVSDALFRLRDANVIGSNRMGRHELCWGRSDEEVPL